MPVAALAVQGGGVPLLTAVGTAPPGTGLLADGGSEDDLDLPDFLGEVQPCRGRWLGSWVEPRHIPDLQSLVQKALRMMGAAYSIF